MEAGQLLREGLQGIASHKLRAGLAVTGIAIGIGSVVAMVAIGEGAKTYFTREFEKLGADLILVTHQPADDKALRAGDGRERPLTTSDGRRVLEACPLVSAWSAESMLETSTATAGGKSAEIDGHAVLPSYQALRGFLVDQGRPLNDEDEAQAAAVCLLGVDVAADLFGESSAVGRDVLLGAAADPTGKDPPAQGIRLKVVGVLSPKGQAMWIDFDRYVLMPMSTAQKRLKGTAGVDRLLFQVTPGADADRAAFGVERLLANLHHGTVDFRVRLQAEFRESMENTLRIFQYFIGGIAAVSLLVGGIGIMNIMLISVLERTREIGVRMALGARKRHILGQFLAEALVIGATGGLLGMILGPLLGQGVASILTWAWEMEKPWQSVASPLLAAGALGFSLLVGVASGIYPAIKASRLDPVEALRYE